MFGFGRKRKDLFDVLYGKGARSGRSRSRQTADVPTVNISALGEYVGRWDDGEKFPGGFGPTSIFYADYWTLRARSAELFERNLYARGMIRRLVTNEINTGLHLEATPEEKVLGLKEDSLADWSEDVETRFTLWGDTRFCHQGQALTFGELQAAARRESLVAGDVLVVLSQNNAMKRPQLELVNGERVQTPINQAFQRADANKVVHGVELDANKRQVAYWVRQDDGSSKRLPAFDSSGRRVSWLLYGTDKRHDDVRGKPILALVLQCLKEVDRYRDAAVRKAVINSFLAAWVEKSEDKLSSLALGGGATVKGTAQAAGPDGRARTFRVQEQIPGLVVEELQHGEKIHPHTSAGTDERFGSFEESMIQSVAWACEIPPEILRLSFTNNYSASQAAINEFKTYLNKIRTDFGRGFCVPIYHDWLISEVLNGKIEADGLLEAWRDPSQYDVLGAWFSCDWSGNIKPAVDLTKLTTGYEALIRLGLITRDRASRELTGTKFSKNVRKLKRENEQLAEANRVLVELEQPPAPAPPADSDPNDIDREEDDDEEDEKAKRRAKLHVALVDSR